MKIASGLRQGILSDLAGVTVCPLTACNLRCSYCYQDAEQIPGPPHPLPDVHDPVRLATGLTTLLSLSKRRHHSIVLSGGEPLLLTEAWYRAFFSAMDGETTASKEIDYSLQTNMLRWDDGVMSLLTERRVHFSVHYDGLANDASLRSEERRGNIERLHAKGCAITAIVVGTPPALDGLSATLELFRRCGVKHYHLNCVSCEGRGAGSPQPNPGRRAEAEFESAFFASQSDFATWDPVIMNKFVSYARWSSGRKKPPPTPLPQRCGAGTKTVVISSDGMIYPCGFFPQATGPIGNLAGLPALDPEAAKSISLCERMSPFFEERCPECLALPICGDYCALTPTGDSGFMFSFCESQRRLMTLMEENPRLVTVVVKRFLGYRTARPLERPTTCGVIYEDEDNVVSESSGRLWCGPPRLGLFRLPEMRRGDGRSG
jgi:radical SAM protein with 4Fe4S-binding SPASM domain